jgi:hypothetical protein
MDGGPQQKIERTGENNLTYTSHGEKRKAVCSVYCLEHGEEDSQDRQASASENRPQGEAVPLRQVPAKKPETGHDAGSLVLPPLWGSARELNSRNCGGRRMSKGRLEAFSRS